MSNQQETDEQERYRLKEQARRQREQAPVDPPQP